MKPRQPFETLRYGLVFAAPLDDASCADVGPLRLSPTITGSPTSVDSGPFGKAVSFNGTTDYVRYPAHEACKLGTRFGWSLAFWVYTNSIASVRMLFEIANTSGQCFDALVLTNPAIRFQQRGSASDICSTENFTNTTWYHYACRGSAMQIRVIRTDLSGAQFNETLTNTAQAGYTSNAQDGAGITIGATVVTTPAQFHSGYASRVAMWNRCLTDSELALTHKWRF